MAFEAVLVSEVDVWFLGLDLETATTVTAAIDRLVQDGPTLGRPLVDRIKGSDLHNLKELRPASSTVRILFIFDEARQAVLLVAGDKAGQWTKWYAENIPVAEARYEKWCKGGYANE